MKKYLLAAIFITAVYTVNAQVKYTDITPDSSWKFTLVQMFEADSALDLDIDGNNTVDFNFKYEYIVGFGGVNWKIQLHTTHPSNQAYWAGNNTSGGNHYIKGVNKGDSITPSSFFGVDRNPLFGDDKDTGLVNKGDKYIGFRFISNGNRHYGWMLLSTRYTVGALDRGEIIVKEFAYNTVPEKGINAGQKFTTGIAENNFPTTIQAYPNPNNGDLSLNLGETYINVEVKVSNLLGKQVYQNTYATAKEIPLNIAAAPGVYIVNISTATHNTNIKVLKQ